MEGSKIEQQLNKWRHVVMLPMKLGDPSRKRENFCGAFLLHVDPVDEGLTVLHVLCNKGSQSARHNDLFIMVVGTGLG